MRDGTTGPPAATETAAPSASASADVFILREVGSRWTCAARCSVQEKPVSFTPSQFSPANFVTFTDLPGHIVVAVRRRLRAAGRVGLSAEWGTWVMVPVPPGLTTAFPSPAR